jgi:hypothetical protein
MTIIPEIQRMTCSSNTLRKSGYNRLFDSRRRTLLDVVFSGALPKNLYIPLAGAETAAVDFRFAASHSALCSLTYVGLALFNVL